MQPGTPKRGAVAAVLSGSVLACCSFVGFETSVNAAEETRDPRRSRPRTLFGALADGERRPCRIPAMGVSAAACPGPPCGG
jgi:amino acid transporter